MLALLGDAEAHGAMLALNTEVLGCKYNPRSQKFDMDIETTLSGNKGKETSSLECDYVINSTGLSSPSFARNVTFNSGATDRSYLPEIPTMYAKGSYFRLARKGIENSPKDTKPFR